METDIDETYPGKSTKCMEVRKYNGELATKQGDKLTMRIGFFVYMDTIQ